MHPNLPTVILDQGIVETGLAPISQPLDWLLRGNKPGTDLTRPKSGDNSSGQADSVESFSSFGVDEEPR